MVKLIDLHCDTILKLIEDPKSGLLNNDFSIDFTKMKKADSMAQVFAIFVDKEAVEDPTEMGWKMLERFWDELNKNADIIEWAGSGSDIRKNQLHGKMSGMIAIEEGAVLGGELGQLHNFYRQGVRLVTLTWNYPNEIGFPHGKEHFDKGLTPFGIQLIEEMKLSGMISDVSHLSEAGFWDVAKTLKSPFMATHSNCRALRDHSRNLTDSQIKALAECGGVMGINVVKNFLLEGEDVGRIEQMVAHVQHAEKVGGIEVIALGSDFDGTSTNEELQTLPDFEKLLAALKQAGYSDDAIDKIWFQNSLRVFDDVLG